VLFAEPSAGCSFIWEHLIFYLFLFLSLRPNPKTGKSALLPNGAHYFPHTECWERCLYVRFTRLSVAVISAFIYEGLSEVTRLLYINLTALPATFSRSNSTVGASSQPREYMKKQADCFAAAFGETAQMEDTTLDQKNYPLTRFWTPENFKKYVSTNPGASRISFLEGEDGNLIPEAMAADIRSVLRTKFKDMYRHMPELFPAGWDKNAATEAFETSLYKFLRIKFPVFRLCSNNWKARQFLIEWYPNWHRRITKKGGSSEEAEEDVDTLKPMATKKRGNEALSCQTFRTPCSFQFSVN